MRPNERIGLSYQIETVLSNVITKNRIVPSSKVIPRKKLIRTASVPLARIVPRRAGSLARSLAAHRKDGEDDDDDAE